MYTTIMKSLTFVTCMVSEKIPILKFRQAQTLDQPKTCKSSQMNTHKSRTIYIVQDLLNVLANIQHLSYSRQESEQEANKKSKRSDDSYSSAKR